MDRQTFIALTSNLMAATKQSMALEAMLHLTEHDGIQILLVNKAPAPTPGTPPTLDISVRLDNSLSSQSTLREVVLEVLNDLLAYSIKNEQSLYKRFRIEPVDPP